MAAYLRSSPFNPQDELIQYERGLRAGTAGARVDFTGFMRDFHDGRQVESMYLEHYPGMTEKFLEKVCDDARNKWDVLDILIVHRVESVVPGEPLVLVSVWSVHRSDAFDACRYLITALKQEAPFWKRETTAQGEQWVHGNTDDDASGYSGD